MLVSTAIQVVHARVSDSCCCHWLPSFKPFGCNGSRLLLHTTKLHDVPDRAHHLSGQWPSGSGGGPLSFRRSSSPSQTALFGLIDIACATRIASSARPSSEPRWHMSVLACRLLQPGATCSASAIRRRCILRWTQPADGWSRYQQRRVGNDRSSSADAGLQPLAPGRSPVAAAASVRDDLLRGVDAENRDAVARIVEQAQRAADSWTVVFSDFHTPPVVADAVMVLQASRRWASIC